MNNSTLRQSLRLSATLLLVGQVLYIVITLFHTAGDANNHPAIFAAYTASENWTADHLGQYRRRGGGSPMDFTRQLDAKWARLTESGMLEPLSGDRCVVSPVLRTVFGADQVAALSAEYARLAKESA